MRWVAAVLFALLLSTTVHAQTTPSAQPKIDDLVRLLQDPDVRAWLESQKPKSATAPPSTSAAPASDLEDWDNQTRSRIRTVISAIPRIPTEIAAASARTRADAMSHGYAPVMAIFAVLVAIGAAAEQLFLRIRAVRFAKAPGAFAAAGAKLLPVVIFALVIGVIFFAFDWPPLARITLLVYLIAFVAYRFLAVFAVFCVDNDRLLWRVRLFMGILALAIATRSLGTPLGVDPTVTMAISYCLSVVLLLIGVEAIWRTSTKSRVIKGALTLFLVALWVLWCLNLKGLVWIGIYALILPGILKAVGRSIEGAISSEDGSHQSRVRTIFLVRGSRAVVIAIAAGWLAVVWQFNPDSVAHQDPTLTAIFYGLLKSVVVLLVADLIWHITRGFIDDKLQTFSADPSAHGGEAASQHRIATLLPIFKNALAVFVLAATVLTVLAQLGVQIGPLIAGAGIFGVALGFGSQTLVKDVISGIFYMLDDAFRVGEYIQSGSYKGTVESFSLRSVRLRHHRGPIFTVPFGSLGAVQNMSRDWVIDKFMLRVPFNTDVAKVKKLVKGVGAELLADEELGPFIIETVKMKGVEQIGDFGMEISFAFTTAPGHQSMIRRRAYTMIRDVFMANGIEFATPTVQVGGEEKAAAVAAASATVTAAKAEQAKAAMPEG
ncbi:mechanosensitive ion channel family protein [Rhizobium mayense]|uniref:Mechanosensitive ion channel family protein n=1 Tax=Rhizobium mayense TaxID=1312184 RepID=A0ABT7K236_9HYPH|nr:mechanosensitive ion channel family protein [Rhizobium mayense]MDL2402672.1 mechanosensitive ion channel family protein [Rhizobium mayense]